MEVSVRHAVWATQHARSRKCVPLSSFHRTEQGRSSALSRHWLSDTCAGQTATTRAADAHRRSWRWLVAWCVSPLHLRSWYQQRFHSSLKKNDSMIKIIGTNSLSTTRWRFNFLLCTQTVWKRQAVQFVHLQPADQLCLVTVALLTAADVLWPTESPLTQHSRDFEESHFFCVSLIMCPDQCRKWVPRRRAAG